MMNTKLLKYFLNTKAIEKKLKIKQKHYLLELNHTTSKYFMLKNIISVLSKKALNTVKKILNVLSSCSYQQKIFLQMK